jgi:predicted O-linked N-acetylglucosamine transferase (SPINDLY family)
MRLLGDVDGSVLWLRDGMPGAVKNLQTEAEQRGVDPARLVFAPRAERADHLARHRLADLSLDTQYHTGGVTTLDSLWAGVPVISIAGAAHSERTGASILNAIGFPELAVGDIEVYEAVARDLARNPKALAALRERLAKNLETTPLFNVKRLAHHVEAAYRLMWESFSTGDSPKTIHVPPGD